MARSFTITQDGESRAFTIATGVGPSGTNGSDADVTESNVLAALGYTPADNADLGGAALLDVGTTAGTVAAGNHTHVSADITDATSLPTANKIVLRGINGEAYFGASGAFSGNGLTAEAGAGTAVRGVTNSGSGGYFSSGSGSGFIATSNSSRGFYAATSTGDNHAEFGGTGSDRSFVARLLGAFGWWRGAYTLMVSAVDTLTANRVQRFQDDDGTIALTKNITGTNSGTNTGDVTATDSSEIDFTLTGQNLTASIIAGSIDETKLDASVNASLDLADTSVQLSGDQTIAGIKQFSSTTRPTSAGAGTPAATSLITLADYQLEVLYDRHRKSMQQFGWNVPTITVGSGGSSSINGNGAAISVSSAAAGSYRYASFGGLNPSHSWSGIYTNFARPFIASGVFYVHTFVDSIECMRVIIGSAASYLSGANAFASNGLGLEVMNVGGTYKIRFIYYSSSAYKQSSWATIFAGTMFNRSNAFVIVNNGAGTASLYLNSYTDAQNTKPPVATITPLITITDAPTGYANSGEFGASIATTAAAAAVANATAIVQNFRLEFTA